MLIICFAAYYHVAIASEGGNADAEKDVEKDKKDHGQKGTTRKRVKRIVKRVIASASGAKVEVPKDAKIDKSPAIVEAANQNATEKDEKDKKDGSVSVKKVYLADLPTERHTTKENIETFFKPETYQKGGPTSAPAAEVSTSEPCATRPVSPEVSEPAMPEVISGENVEATQPPIEPPGVDKPTDDVEDTKTNDGEQIEDTEKQTEETKEDNEQENTKKEEQTEDTHELPHDQNKAHDNGTEGPKTPELATVDTEKKEMQEGNEGNDEEKTNQCTDTPEDTNEEWNSHDWYSWKSYNNWNWNSWNSWGWWTNTESPNQEWSDTKGSLRTPESALTRLASTDSFERCLNRASTVDIEKAGGDGESPAGADAKAEKNTEKTEPTEPEKVDAEPEATQKELAKKKAHARYMRYYRSVHESRDLNIKLLYMNSSSSVFANISLYNIRHPN